WRAGLAVTGSACSCPTARSRGSWASPAVLTEAADRTGRLARARAAWARPRRGRPTGRPVGVDRGRRVGARRDRRACADDPRRRLAARGQAPGQAHVPAGRGRGGRDRRELEVLHRLAVSLPRSLTVTGVTDALAEGLV